MTLPLQGIRIIDFTIFEVGPAGTAFLADMGADVIHVEQPGTGDPQRGLHHFMGQDISLPGGRNMSFEEHNRNKRGIVLDLKHPLGQEAMHRLVANSDVFVTNFRPKAVAKLRLDYDTLKQHNERLIYAQATGFGMRGPEADSPSVDLVAQARSGLMLGSGEQDMPPIQVTVGIADRTSSLMLAFGILGALVVRERLDIGQQLDVSQLGSMLAVQAWTLTPPLFRNWEYPRANRERAGNPLYNFYQCKDGRWLAFALFVGERYWPDFCRAIGKPELVDDPKFHDERARNQHNEELIAILDEVFAIKTADEWYPILKERGDFLFSVVNSPLSVISDPQVLANDYVVEWDHPTLGPIKFLGFPVRFSQTPASLRLPAPEFGQHTEEVLLEVAGYSWDDLGQLKADGVIP